MSLFSGYAGAYGTHGGTEKSVAKGGKLEIKKSARTVREPVTVELWEGHLRGERPLGIIPVSEESLCVWGCIDVDKYDLNLADTVKKIRLAKMPLVLCRSKSGGAHVFLFLSTPVEAEVMRGMLKQIAASMGWGDCEIFPKQSQILSDRGDLGSWLNMPYFNADKTERYAVKETGNACTIGEFLALAEKSKVDPKKVPLPDHQDDTLQDGPPCLQHLTTVGVPEGTRNNGLFALGVFCKKKFGERWEEILEKYNREYMKPPLTHEEVASVVKSLRKKDYNYACKEQPLCSYCNATLCKSRKFGVGGGGAYPVISGMSKLDAGEDTLWFLDIEDARIELSTRQLQNYKEFQTVCMNELTVFFMPMKAETWASMVGEAMANAMIIEPEPEQTAHGHFMELLEEFCKNRHRGEKMEDLFLGKPYLSEEDGRHYFRLKNLMDFLERSGFKRWGRNTVGERIKEIGGKHFFNLRGRGVNTLWVPDSVFEEMPESEIPEARRDPI